jgi:hypothetical protein
MGFVLSVGLVEGIEDLDRRLVDSNVRKSAHVATST